MSADNGIYIARFFSGYKVIHAQNIEDLDYYEENTKERKEVWKKFFKNAKTFKDASKALEYAVKLFEKESIVEYGIVDLGRGEEYEENNWA